MKPLWFERDRSGSPGGAADPFIIAEIGVNHDGDVDKALALVDAAAKADADAVKAQCFRADLLLSREARLASYQQAAGETDPAAMLRRLELSMDELGAIAARAHARGLRAIVTIFSVELVEDALRIPWDACKTASPDIVHKPLLEALLEAGRPMIVSAGAADEAEVARALRLVRSRLKPARLAALHCVSAYPTPDEWAYLGGIEAIADIAQREAPGASAGYSDHTQREDAGAMAVALGARVLEKHLTLDRSAPGPDHAASLEPEQFARYTARARTAAREGDLVEIRRRFELAPGGRLYGERTRRVLDIERDVRDASRQSIVAARAIGASERLARTDLTFRRPGVGVSPWDIDTVVGAVAAHAIAAGAMIQRKDLA